MERFEVKDLPLDGAKIVIRKPKWDDRGCFERMFCEEELITLLGHRRIVQINHSVTYKKGTVRGLHFQHPPNAELKLVSCIKGKIFDVIVDLRKGSPTLLQWHGEILAANTFKTLLVPEGFAHGFQTLDDDTELIYFVTSPYRPSHEDGLNPLEPRLNIPWPCEINTISERDSHFPFLDDGFEGITLEGNVTGQKETA
mgnify:CR=1 FL=1